MQFTENGLDSNGHGRELALNGVIYQSNRDAVALHLARGETIAKTAELTGVGARTIDRWKTEEGFRKRVAELRAELLQTTMGRLIDAGVAAVDALTTLLKSTNETTVLSAATAILKSVERQTGGANVLATGTPSVTKVFVGIDIDEV